MLQEETSSYRSLHVEEGKISLALWLLIGTECTKLSVQGREGTEALSSYRELRIYKMSLERG